MLRASRIARGISDWRCCLKRRAVHTVNSACLRRRAHILINFEQRVSQQLKKYTHVTKENKRSRCGERCGGPCPRLCAAAAALLLAHPRPAHPSTRGWAPYSLSAQRAGARTAALTSGSGSRPTAAPTHTEQHAQDSHRTLPLTPLTATGYSDLITGTSLSTPCTRLPVAVASAASCPDQTPATRRRR